MNASYEFRNGYLYISVMGVFSINRAKELVLEWVEIANQHAITKLFCDITLVTKFDVQDTSTMTIFEIAKFVAESLPKGFKLAVLETPQQFEKDKFGETVMVNRGALVKVTPHLSEAFQWLGLLMDKKPDPGSKRE